MQFKTSLFEIEATTTGLYVRLAHLGALDLTFRSPVPAWFAGRDGEAFAFSLGRLRGCLDAG